MFLLHIVKAILVYLMTALAFVVVMILCLHFDIEIDADVLYHRFITTACLAGWALYFSKR